MVGAPAGPSLTSFDYKGSHVQSQRAVDSRADLSRLSVAAWRNLPETTRGYVVAVVTVIAAAVAISFLREFLDHSIFILFAAPIALSAWYGGRGPAFIAML